MRKERDKTAQATHSPRPSAVQRSTARQEARVVAGPAEAAAGGGLCVGL